MSLLFFVILFTTRQNDLVRGLVRLGLPFEWGLTLAIALRYIPTFTHAVAQIQDAQAAAAGRCRLATYRPAARHHPCARGADHWCLAHQ